MVTVTLLPLSLKRDQFAEKKDENMRHTMDIDRLVAERIVVGIAVVTTKET